MFLAAAPMSSSVVLLAAAATATSQGLTLLHFSAQRKPILCNTLGA
jgi:hypothetical protein